MSVKGTSRCQLRYLWAMVRFEATVEISRPAEQVFDFVSDLENDARWVKNWHSKRTSQARELGATYARWYHWPLGKPVEAAVTVTAWERPRRFAFESVTADGKAVIEFRFEPTAGGVRVTKIDQMHHGGVMGFVSKVFAFGFRSDLRRILRNLKAVVEAAP